jgi:type I restriction enzyme, S subunit
VSFRPYDRYKDSGVDWLGIVPNHWTVKSIKRLSPVMRGASPRPIEDAKYFDDEGEYCWVRIADVSASSGLLMETPQRLSGLGSSLSVRLEPGALFVSIAGSVGKPCILGVKACIHDGFVYFPRLKIPARFLYRIFEAATCYAGLGKLGTQLNLNTDTIGDIRIAVPPTDELEAIDLFLDRETAKIDGLIAEQERLIALLKEKRQAVISHAVTKGLAPNAPMKDSGVEWLGEVPAHWEVTPIGRLCTYISYGFTNPMPVAHDGPVMLTANDVDYGSVRYESARRTTEEAFHQLLTDKSRPVAGDLLLTKDGTLGRVAIHDGTLACINQSVAVLRPDTAIVASRFLGLALLGGLYQDRMIYEAGGTTIKHIYISRLSKMPLVVPPLREQEAITDRLERMIARYAQLVSAAEAAVSLLQERRSALITAAVTGKIDVRGVAAPEAEAA